MNNLHTESGKKLGSVGVTHAPLLLTGLLGSLIYIFNVVLGGTITPNHSHIRNAVSELTQRGAPNIVVLSAFFVLSASLLMIFGITVAAYFRQQSRRVSMGGILIVTYGLFAALLATVFPQDPIGTEATFPGTMHLVLAGLTALVVVGALLLIGFGCPQLDGNWQNFKLYSVITVLVMLIFGISTPILLMNNIELLGLFERLTQLTYLQWFAVFSFKVYRESATP